MEGRAPVRKCVALTDGCTHRHDLVLSPQVGVVLDEGSLCEQRNLDGVNAGLIPQHALYRLHADQLAATKKRRVRSSTHFDTSPARHPFYSELALLR